MLFRSATATVVWLSAQSVLRLLGTRVREEGMTASGLASFLVGERARLRGSLPFRLSEIFTTSSWSSPVIAQSVENSRIIAQRIEANSVLAQAVEKKRTYIPWFLGFLALALFLGCLWYFWPRQPAVTEASAMSSPAVAGERPGSAASGELWTDHAG